MNHTFKLLALTVFAVLSPNQLTAAAKMASFLKWVTYGGDTMPNPAHVQWANEKSAAARNLRRALLDENLSHAEQESIRSSSESELLTFAEARAEAEARPLRTQASTARLVGEKSLTSQALNATQEQKVQSAIREFQTASKAEQPQETVPAETKNKLYCFAGRWGLPALFLGAAFLTAKNNPTSFPFSSFPEVSITTISRSCAFSAGAFLTSSCLAEINSYNLKDLALKGAIVGTFGFVATAILSGRTY